MQAHVDSFEDQVLLRKQLKERRLVAFIKDGAILPRASGADDYPLLFGIPFQSPESLSTAFQALLEWA
jgi:predicted ABC-class ATPase